MALTITSIAYADGQAIPQRFGCTRLGGQDANPPWTVAGVPEATQSLAVIFDDPDAGEGTWTHWLFWDLDPTTKEIPEGTTAEALGATPGQNSWGRKNHGGPCPPNGTHRYVVRVYALDGPVDLAAGATADHVREAMAGKILAEAALTGTFTA